MSVPMSSERIRSHHAASTRSPSTRQTARLSSQTHVIPKPFCLFPPQPCMHSSARPRTPTRCVGSTSAQTNVTEQASTGYAVVGCAPCMDGTLSVNIDESKVVTKFIAETLLPTRHGNFRLRGYKHSIDGGVTFTEPTAVIAGIVEGKEDVPVRVHDACYTSEVLGSLKCDCAEQLALAMQHIYKSPPGMVIYLQQEGRGIGLANKIAAYSLQEQGLDTVDANRALGLPDDCREYTSVRNIIRGLGIKSVKLMTNNPRKINQLTALGIEITGRVPCIVEAGEHNQGYLDTKRDRMDHLLEEQAPPLQGQWCYWNHDGEPRVSASAASPMSGGMGLPNGAKVLPNGQIVGLAGSESAAAE